MARTPSRRSGASEIARFLGTSKAIRTVSRQQSRLLFAIDATASRQPSWDAACQQQQAMFDATRQSSLSVQLCYYRGFNEFFASPWLSDAQSLGRTMRRVHCEGGHTQIARLLRHALHQHRQETVRAVVFIGDALEEDPGLLRQLAGECGLRKLPLFLFQEGDDPPVRHTLQKMAGLSGGAWAHFDQSSAATLAALLSAVGRYASGGRKALENATDESAKLLLRQLTP